ncbi:MAG TPA: gamma-glutamyl-gamma-aminobutyrate hydrolase family protein [Pyrinomonadaceae bacterium]|nr:gamma-glutamyl-gamma-aminobutyrate hydrolase family protein [Pyrinomonadaceae bacterium]
MIYLIDNTIDGEGPSPRELQRSLKSIAPESEVVMEPFRNVSPARVHELQPSHIILSGQSHPWHLYSDESLQGIFGVIQTADVPILGVCGGHQQMALAFGAKVDLMERIAPGEGYEGAKRERGFLPVETLGNGIFSGLPNQITVWHSHCDEVKELPPGFKRTAWNDTCAIQAMQHCERPLFGVQFHPELFDSEHPHGREIVANFLAI